MEFLRKPFGIVDRILNLRGPQTSVGDFDIAAPVVPVFDLSRGAAYGAGPGYVTLSLPALTHAAGNTQTEEVRVGDYFDSMPKIREANYASEDLCVWILDVSASISSAATFTRLAVGLDPAWPTGHSNPVRPLLYSEDDFSFSDNGGILKIVTGNDFNPPYPIPCGENDYLTGRSASTGVLSVQVHFHTWIGPWGTMPPA